MSKYNSKSYNHHVQSMSIAGLEMCQWMVGRGAKKLIITSRSGVKTGYQNWKMDNFKANGVQVEVSNLDVSEYDQADQLLQEADRMGPVGGVFHLAAVS